MEIKQKVRRFISKFIKTDDISDDENIFLISVNSLFAMQLIMFIESEFDIDVSNEDINIDNFNSINSISAYIEKALAR